MKTPKYLFLLFCLALFVGVAAQIPPKPHDRTFVNDFAKILPDSARSAMEQRLVAFSDTTSNQIVVVTTIDLAGYDIAEYAQQIGRKWKVGQDKFDNGVVIAVKPKIKDDTGGVFIATGYGLEGAIPDATCKRIIENKMIPFFMKGDYAAGIAGALDELIPLACGEYKSDEYNEKENNERAQWITYLSILGVIILLVVLDHFGLLGKGGGTTYSSGGSHSFSGGYGGSSSGGGSFGGGSFGGGGARGSW